MQISTASKLVLIGVVLIVGISLAFIYNDTVDNNGQTEINGGNESVSEYEVGGVEQKQMPTDDWHTNKYQLSSQPDWKSNKNITERELEAGHLYEVTRFPNAKPTRKQFEEAWEMYSKSYESAEENGWFEFENATEDGYKKFDLYHYMNKGYYVDNETLNPDKPESLIYYDDPDNNSNKILVGYMYVANGLDEHGYQFGGPLTVWHYHQYEKKDCFTGMLSMGEEFKDTRCSDGEVKRFRSPEMVHIWFIENPNGPFASGMSIPPEYVEEPDKMSKKEFRKTLQKTVLNKSG